MTAQVGGAVVSPSARSRFANLIGFLPSDPVNRSRDDDWHIPYNGPIEPPHNEEKSFLGRSRQPPPSNSTRRSFTSSSQGIRSSSGGGWIGEAPVNNTASTRDKPSTTGTRERSATYDRGSVYTREGNSDREKTKDRERGSIASLLTFGGSRRRTLVDADSDVKAQGQARPSEEFRFPVRKSEESRSVSQGWHSDESTFNAHLSHQGSHAYSPFGQHPQSQPQTYAAAALSFTPADRERDQEKRRDGPPRESMEVTGMGRRPSNADAEIPPRRRYGMVEPKLDWQGEGDHVASSERQRVSQDEPALASSTSPSVMPSATPQPHPYAVVFPSTVHDPPPSQHYIPPSLLQPPVHSQFTAGRTPFPPAGSSNSHETNLSVTISPAAIAATLNKPPRNLLRKRSGTHSTPNLRLAAARDRERVARGLNAGLVLDVGKADKEKAKTMYAVETWCDALMFPRPRFRAHFITPPGSPVDELPEGFGPSGLQRSMSSRSPYRGRGPFVGAAHYMPAQYVAQRSGETQPLPIGKQFERSPQPQGPPPAFEPTSPGEENMQRVLAEGEQRDREREVWGTIARQSFQNRRSRSLSRTRKNSGPGVRVRVGSDAARSREGLNSRSVAASLAAEAFRQNTPTITGTMSSVARTNGMSVMHSVMHSRNASRQGSGQGHTRHSSYNRTAATSENHETSAGEKLEGALMTEETKRLSVRGRREEAAEADVQILDIAPKEPTPEAVRGQAKAEPPGDRSESQNSYTSETQGVGIAISTPMFPDQDLPDLSGHPYAPSSRWREEPVPVSAPYAGPHPTAVDYIQSHDPWKQDVQQPVSKSEPVKWERTRSPDAYAYAHVSVEDLRESVLGVEEVLMSRAFRNRTMSEFGDFTNFDGEDEKGKSTENVASTRNEGSLPSTRSGSRVRRKPVELNSAYSEAHPMPPSGATDDKDDKEPEVPEVLEFVRPFAREGSTALSSPTSQGTDDTNPRPLDDLESFRDLFYKPAHSGSDSHRRVSSELLRILASQHESMASWSEERIKSSEGLNGLRALLNRPFSQEPPELPQRAERGDPEGAERPSDSQEVEVRELNGEPLQLGTPLRAEYEEGQNFPEDIESSRASSIMQPESHGSAEETMRVGTAPLAVAETTEPESRHSAAFSIGDTEDTTSQRPKRDTVVTTTSSLGVPSLNVEDLIRTSFATSASSASHMSNLIGDFPVPPPTSDSRRSSAPAATWDPSLVLPDSAVLRTDDHIPPAPAWDPSLVLPDSAEIKTDGHASAPAWSPSFALPDSAELRTDGQAPAASWNPSPALPDSAELRTDNQAPAASWNPSPALPDSAELRTDNQAPAAAWDPSPALPDSAELRTDNQVPDVVSK